jgi:hypothetical protein
MTEVPFSETFMGTIAPPQECFLVARFAIAGVVTPTFWNKRVGIGKVVGISVQRKDGDGNVSLRQNEC